MRRILGIAGGASAAVAALALAQPASAQSSAWRVESYGRGDIPVASTCDVRRRGEVCAIVWCPRGEMEFAMRGLRRGPNDRRGAGDIRIDNMRRSVNWEYTETRGGESLYTAQLNPPRNFFNNLQRGYTVAVDLGPRRGEREFSLRGSSRAIGVVERYCRGDYRTRGRGYGADLDNASLFEVIIAGVLNDAFDDDDRRGDDRRGYDGRDRDGRDRDARYGGRDRYNRDGRRGPGRREMIDARQVHQVLTQAGYMRIRDIELDRDDGVYEADAQDRRGRNVEVEVNAFTGEITDVEHDRRGRRGDRGPRGRNNR